MMLLTMLTMIYFFLKPLTHADDELNAHLLRIGHRPACFVEFVRV
jgi:hypothetical protein